MNKHIDKDVGDVDKLHLSSFLKIRKKNMIQFLNERELNSLEEFENVMNNELNNYFYISNDLIQEAKNYFLSKETANNQITLDEKKLESTNEEVTTLIASEETIYPVEDASKSIKKTKSKKNNI